MDEEIKSLYVYILKYRWTPKDQSIQLWKGNFKSNYRYFIDLISSKTNDKRWFFLKPKKNKWGSRANDG